MRFTNVWVPENNFMGHVLFRIWNINWGKQLMYFSHTILNGFIESEKKKTFVAIKFPLNHRAISFVSSSVKFDCGFMNWFWLLSQKFSENPAMALFFFLSFFFNLHLPLSFSISSTLLLFSVCAQWQEIHAYLSQCTIVLRSCLGA